MKKLASGVVTLYHYDYAGNLIAETDGSGTALRDYVYLGSERVAMRIYGAQAGWYYFINDHLGTPHKVVDASGDVVWEAAYSPFGHAQIITETVTNNFRFPGQYYDAESGLHYNWHRYYDPKTGRYLTPDPIGLEGGVNLFVYALGNPVSNFDPDGRFVLPWLVYVIMPVAITMSGFYAWQQTIALMQSASSGHDAGDAPFGGTSASGACPPGDPDDDENKKIRPEAKYLKAKKHGLKWKEGPATARSTGKPQGQWGSRADLDFAAEKAATLRPGQGGWFDLPEGHTSMVHMPDGRTIPATRIWIRNNGTGTFHGYPAP